MSLAPVATDRIVATLTELERLGGDGPTTTWRAGTLGLPTGFVMGAQLVGQVIAAAAKLDAEQPVRSLNVAFVKPVPEVGHVDFTVTTLHRGKQYSTQRVEVVQRGRDGRPEVAIAAHVLSHRPAPGIEHGAAMPAHAGTPELARPVDLGIVPGEQRLVGDTDLDDPRVQPNEYLMWTRLPEPLGDDPVVHQALLALPSELTLIGTALLQHGEWSQADAHLTLRTAVLSHQMVFHRPFRYDDWLLFSQTSPAASAGSSYGRADVFAADGVHVASVSQEAMVRVNEQAR